MSGNPILMTQAQYTRHRGESPQYIGMLVPTGEVSIKWYTLGRQIRDRVLGIASKLAPQLAAETDVRRLRGEESWSVEYRVLPGDPSAPAVWQALDEFLTQPWPQERGITLPVAACCIDSGFHTQQVYEFARTRFHQRVFTIKGKAGPLPVWPKRPNCKNGTLLYTVGVDSAKATVYGRLKIVEPSPGFRHFAADRGQEYFEQLLSEVLVRTYSRGSGVREWRRKKGTRGEALDCRVYAFAALQALISMGLSLDREAERILALAAHAHLPAAPRVARSRRMQE